MTFEAKPSYDYNSSRLCSDDDSVHHLQRTIESPESKRPARCSLNLWVFQARQLCGPGTLWIALMEQRRYLLIQFFVVVPTIAAVLVTLIGRVGDEQGLRDARIVRIVRRPLQNALAQKAASIANFRQCFIFTFGSFQLAGIQKARRRHYFRNFLIITIFRFAGFTPPGTFKVVIRIPVTREARKIPAEKRRQSGEFQEHEERCVPAVRLVLGVDEFVYEAGHLGSELDHLGRNLNGNFVIVEQDGARPNV